MLAAMSTLKVRISDTMKTSMKSGDKETLAYVRNLHAAVRKKEIDDRVDLDDAGIQKIVQSLVKQRQDSIEQFKAGGRLDLVGNEERELAFLMSFLPTQMTDAELSTLAAAAVLEAQAKEAKDMGKVMKILMPQVQGKADGKRIQAAVQQALQNSAS